jgi:hypothetical protein
MDPLVAILSPQPSVEAWEEGGTRPRPLGLNPCLDPCARTLHFLARGAAFATRHARSVFFPEQFTAQTGEPARHAWMKATAAQDPGLLRCYRSFAFPQSLRERLVTPFRITAAPKGADQVIGVAASQGLASTLALDSLFNPQLQRLMQLSGGEHRRAHPPWGVPVSGWITRPSVSRIPAFRHVWIRPRKARSSLRNRSSSRTQSWSIWSTKPWMSASPTYPYRPSCRSKVRSRSASPAPRPGRYP